MMEYEEYKRQCKLIREENQIILAAFVSWLSEGGLSESTVRMHRDNIDFYINEFLLYESPKRASEGVGEVGMFLGYWFIRKAMWASETNIRKNAASLKKFYHFMEELGAVDSREVTGMKGRIREELPEWIATAKRYDDPSVDMEDVW